jgi:hypothetical protein
MLGFDLPAFGANFSSTPARMGTFSKQCSICSNRDVAEVVNRMLAEKIACKTIAAHFHNTPSKSSIHRHSQNCVAREKASMVFQDGDDLFAYYADFPGQPPPPETLALIEARRARLRPRARIFLVCITYEAAPSPETLAEIKAFHERAAAASRHPESEIAAVAESEIPPEN